MQVAFRKILVAGSWEIKLTELGRNLTWKVLDANYRYNIYFRK